MKIEVAYMNHSRKKIGGKWKPLIMFILASKKCRFNKLKQLLPGISANMLSSSVRELETNGIVYKHDGVYALTEPGKQIVVLLYEISKIVNSLP